MLLLSSILKRKMSVNVFAVKSNISPSTTLRLGTTRREARVARTTYATCDQFADHVIEVWETNIPSMRSARSSSPRRNLKRRSQRKHQRGRRNEYM